MNDPVIAFDLMILAVAVGVSAVLLPVVYVHERRERRRRLAGAAPAE